MRKLLTGYVVNFNRKHRRYGHLFQNRYKSIICEEDPYLLELTRYIHLNPLRAGIVKDIDGLDSHPWTGHAAIMGRQMYPWQDRNSILAYFGKTEGAAKASYRRFVEKGLTMGRRKDLAGGGLLRSAGGWAEVASLRQRSERMPSDERILGSGTFVNAVLHEAEQGIKKALVRKTRILSLATLAALVSGQEGIEISALLSGSRKRAVAKARRIFCQIAVKKFGYTGASVARHLGVTTSLVNRMAGEDEIAGPESYYESSL
jgi:putative transposase